MAAMLVVIQVVRTHNGPCFSFLHGRFKGRQVNFVECTVGNFHICGVAVEFLVVECVMFYAGRDSDRLHSLYVRHNHYGSEIRVFAEVFEIAAVVRSTENAHSWPENHRLVAVARFLSQAHAVNARHVGIPGSRKAGKSRESQARVIGAAGLVPLVPEHIGAHAVRTVVGPHLGYSQTSHTRGTEFALGVNDVYFLLQCHTLQGIFYALVDRLRLVEVNRRLRIRCYCHNQSGAQ